MRAIIFGANGQDGYYLSKLLQKNGVEITGVSRNGNFLKLDITNYDQIANLIQKIKPDFIFHLAANSTTRHDAMFENHSTICSGTLNILEAVKNKSPETKVFISGSGLQFLNSGVPIKESNDFSANDAYSVSRIHSVYAARYFRRLGIKVYVGYFFNHDSLLRSEGHVSKKISAAALRISKGSSEKVELGDISVIKEWAYAGDIVKGIWLLVNQNEIFEANISNGIGYSIEDWLEECFSLVGKNFRDHFINIPNFRSDYKVLISDNTIIKTLGYKPEISFIELANKMMHEEK